MSPTYALIQALAFALAGWVASCHLLVNSRHRSRRWLVVPLWFVWMALAIGGPVSQGVLSIADAGSTVGGLTAGMTLAMLISARHLRRR
jgi:hypothetical protein